MTFLWKRRGSTGNVTAEHAVMGMVVATVALGLFVGQGVTMPDQSPVVAFLTWWIAVLPNLGPAMLFAPVVLFGALGIIVAAGMALWLFIAVWVSRLAARLF